jgi:hypothetical protein
MFVTAKFLKKEDNLYSFLLLYGLYGEEEEDQTITLLVNSFQQARTEG